MARLFITPKEINFFKHLNKELIQKIIGQEILYYAVSLESSNVNDLYNESIQKVTYTPILINALILYNPPEESTTNFSIDTIYSVEVYLHQHEAEERNVKPREGDFISFGKVVYEIKKITNPQITFGQIAQEVMYKMECIVSRDSNIKIEDNS